MAQPSRDGMGRGEIESAPLPPSANKSLSHSLKNLSINAASATALPLSSQPSSPRAFGRRNSPARTSSPNGRIPPRSPLHRSPSAMSIDTRSSSPALLRKASMNSLHGIGNQSRVPSSPSRRSSSASFHNGSAMVGKSPLSEIEDAVEDKPQHTAESIASNHFKKELELHEKEDGTRPADTIVILHDSCYGHRYSRPRTSKQSLSTIVERPERIHASILGMSVAYVRLGDRHSGGQYPLHPEKNPSDIPTTPFKIRKTTRRLELSSQAVTNVHGTKWMEELKVMCDSAEAKLAMNGKELVRPEKRRSSDQADAAFHEGDLYLCSESLNAMEGALGAVCEGVDAVFQGSASGKGPHRTFVAIRPPGHHCSASYPSGFCWLNNVHVGISHAALTHGLTHAAIIDFDLHHGDGSQAIAWEHNRRATTLPKNALPWKKTSIGYFSLHDINSYPCEMGDEEKVKMASLCIENAHGQSIWNVHLQPWKSEAEFWELYDTKYSILLEKTRNFLRAQTDRLRLLPNGPKPKGAIFLSAGFDASEWESDGMQRHKVNVPTEFYARLTRDVVKIAAEEGSAVEGRIISVLEGGYSDRALCTGVFSHLSGLAGGDPIAIKKEFKINGLAYEMGNKIGTFDGLKKEDEPVTTGTVPYDPLWWSLPQLEQLDATISPTPLPEPKKPREGPPPTYSSPTQSFIAKVASPTARRNVSNMSNHGNGFPRPINPRAPTPPPPEVDWTVASHQLSKLLIPTDRQTQSCRPEDLSAEATKVRRDRQSILTPPTVASTSEQPEPPASRMALRTRKPVKPLVESVDEAKKPATKANRRKTVAGPGVLATDKALSRSTTPAAEPGYTQPTQQSSRRLSVASNSGSVVSEAPSVFSHSRVPSSNLPPLPVRPGASYNARPDSSMSSRGSSIPPVVVKKTRAPVQPRNETAKTTRVRRKSPLTDTGAPAKEYPPILPPSRSSSTVLPSVERSASHDPDMEALTSGMKKASLTTKTQGQGNAQQAKPETKKITKLSLTTKAQREAREKAQLAAKAIRAAEPTPESTAEVAIPSGSGSSLNGNSVDTIPHSDAHLSRSDHPSSVEPQLSPYNTPAIPPVPTLPQTVPADVRGAIEIPLPPSSPPEMQFDSATISPTTSGADIFIPYQPEGPAASTTVQPDSFKWLPPNTSTPANMKKGGLPVFTSTSAIPFGATSGIDQGVPKSANESKLIKQEKKPGDDSIWDVPETPRK